jgi:hypothetical protein
MNNAPIAAGLLLAVLACALAFMPLRISIAGAAVALVATIATLAASPAVPTAIALNGCWVSLIAGALSVYWPRLAQRSKTIPILFSTNAGIWSGLVLAADARGGALIAILASLFLLLPARFCVRRGWTIAPRIVTSWLLAVALLAGSIPHLIDHPGYVPDHRM